MQCWPIQVHLLILSHVRSSSSPAHWCFFSRLTSVTSSENPSKAHRSQISRCILLQGPHGWDSLGSSKTYRLQSRPPEEASQFCVGFLASAATGSPVKLRNNVPSGIFLWLSAYFIFTKRKQKGWKYREAFCHMAPGYHIAYVLAWPKSLFGFCYKMMLQKNPNKLFVQPNASYFYDLYTFSYFIFPTTCNIERGWTATLIYRGEHRGSGSGLLLQGHTASELPGQNRTRVQVFWHLLQ